MSHLPHLKAELSARQNLLPWLAAGTHPCHTSGEGLLCGARALAMSYNTARRIALPEGDILAPADEVTGEDLINGDNRKRPSDLEKQVWDSMNKGGLFADYQYNDRDGWENDFPGELMRAALDINNFDINRLRIWVTELNARFQTHYVLGTITEGFIGKYDQNLGAFDDNYVLPTNANYPGIDEPVIWIYNNGAEQKANRYNPPRQSIGHWSGFDANPNDPNKRLTDAWDLEDEIDADIDFDNGKGVWVITQESQNPNLDAHPGCFVRPTGSNESHPDRPLVIRSSEVKKETRTAYYRDVYAEQMNLTDLEEIIPPLTGRIPVANLKRITKNMMVPGYKPPAKKTTPKPPEVPKPPAKTNAGILAALAKLHEKPQKGPSELPGHGAKPPLTQEGVEIEILCERTNLEFYRTIPPRSKAGEGYDNNRDPGKEFVNGFGFRCPQYVFKCGNERLDTAIHIRDLHAQVGWIKSRSLQRLENPWGLYDMLKDQSAIKSFRYQRYPEQSSSQGWAPLPLRTIISDIRPLPGPSPPKQPGYFDGELVLRICDGIDDGNPHNLKAYVVDYEGRIGRISDSEMYPLERRNFVADPTLNPWGIEFRAEELKHMFDYHVGLYESIQNSTGGVKRPASEVSDDVSVSKKRIWWFK